MPFERPSIDGVQLEPDCKQLLRVQSDRFDAAGAIQQLIAWSPVAFVLTESSPAHAAFSIANTDWDLLATAVATVPRLALITSATESIVHSDGHSGKVKAFWRALSDFYGHEAQSR